MKFQKENLSLNYDEKEKLLYGSYQQGFNRYTKVIYCEDSVSGKNVSQEKQLWTFKRINDIINKYKIVSSDEEIVEIYYLLEKGDFETSDVKMYCNTEEQFLDELIDFSNYLKSEIGLAPKKSLKFILSRIRPLETTFNEKLLQGGPGGTVFSKRVPPGRRRQKLAVLEFFF
ncbi:MAG: hypothetical protein PVH61_05150 [Candidatus Aminicenantes bacterium]